MDLLAVTVAEGIIAILFVVICFLLILVVLLQKGRGGGLAGAFGGAGGHSAFGAKTGDVFTWFTVGLTAMFILVAMIGNWVFVPTKVPVAAQNTPAAPASAPAGEAEDEGNAPTGAGSATRPSG